MGISQLLPLLEKSTRQCHVSEFRGQTVAVDSYCWLHKGARGCALQLIRDENPDTYINYCMNYVKLLLSYDIKPIMVFDGRHLPAKLGTEEKRREQKRQARERGMHLMRLGQSSEAYKFFCQCVEVTPEMALRLIQACRKIHVDCIVAPYESDAQLAFLSTRGIADCVISEDSDLLLFGCKKVLYKMDTNGAGQIVDSDKLHISMNLSPAQYSFDKFRYMCILSGCDYLESLPGIGLKKAAKFLAMTAETDPSIFLARIPRYLKMRNLVVPGDYIEKFLIADATFKHQIVFNPFLKVLEPLNPIEGNEQYCINSGDLFDDKDAYQLALGNLNPLTMQKMDNWRPEDNIVSSFSIWSPRFTKYRAPSLPKPKPSLTKPQPVPDLTKKLEIQDKQIEMELECYKTKSPPKETVQNSQNSPEREENTSPVLCSNPFIKKKFSKFQTTKSIPSDQLVLSRFFQKNERKKTSEECDGENSTEMEIEEQTSTEDDTDSVEIADVGCECTLVVEDRELVISEPATLLSVENLPEEIPGAKRKARSDNGKKKQMTIGEMFKKMKTN